MASEKVGIDARQPGQEPRGYTLQDLMAATLGIGLVLTLPPGISWFDPAAVGFIDRAQLLVAYGIWGCGIGFVALSFAVVARQWNYRRGVRPAEWLILACGALYLLKAFLSLHDRFGSSLISVSKLELRLAQDFGSVARKGIIIGAWAVFAGYVLLLIRFMKPAPHLKTKLSLLLLVGFFWGPCGLWQSHFEPLTNGGLKSLASSKEWLELALPNLLVATVLLGIFHWLVGMCFLVSRATWTAVELGGLVLFVATWTLLGAYSLLASGISAGSVLRLAVIVVIWNLPAAAVGWGLGLLHRKTPAGSSGR
jgi:hypothetical protein